MADKVALITGASKGLGKEFCRVLLNKGAKVCIADVDAASGTSAAHEFNSKFGPDKAFFMKCDVTQINDIKAAFKETTSRYGHVDIVCNNAGIMNEGIWEKMMDINIKGVIYGSQQALEHMSATSGGKGGVIINVASIAGLGAVPGAAVYAATKHAVVGYTRSIAMDYAVNKVRINILCPGFTDTDIMKPPPGGVTDEDFFKVSVEALGMQTVEKVGAAFLSLVEDESANCVVLKVEPNKSPSIKQYRDMRAFPNAKL